MSDLNEIVGHKTFSTGDPMQPFRHEPMTRAEADALWAAAEAAQKKRAADMPTEEAAVRAMTEARQRLIELGWEDVCYAPKHVPLMLIEPGSSGIHQGSNDGDWPNQRFWIEDGGDIWPSRPVLFKLRESAEGGG